MHAQLHAILPVLLALQGTAYSRQLLQSSPAALPSPVPSLIVMLGQGAAEGEYCTRLLCAVVMDALQRQLALTIAGPIFYKSIEAMVYTVAASEGRTSGLPVGESSRPHASFASAHAPFLVRMI